MKLLIILVVFAFASVRSDEKYSSKYDDFDIKQLTENPRLMNAYIQCFLGEGKCTPEGADISKWIPEAISTACEKCTDKQKGLIADMMKTMMDSHPEGWEKLRNKFDSENTHADDIKQFIEKYAQLK